MGCRQRRLQKLAQTKLSPPADDHQSGGSTPATPIPSPMGLSVSGLRQAIRRVERSIESEMIDSADGPHIRDQFSSTPSRRKTSPDPVTSTDVIGIDQRHGSGSMDDGGLRVYLKDSQLRMAVWLNSLPWKKTLTWYPDIANSHAVIIVRSAPPRGERPLRWSRKLTSATEIRRAFRSTIGVEDCYGAGPRESWTRRARTA